MNRKRTVSKQLSIFDILNCYPLDLLNKKTIRIMHEYDAIDNTDVFTILNGDISIEAADSIIAWLKENVTKDELIYGLDTKEIDFANNRRSKTEDVMDFSLEGSDPGICVACESNPQIPFFE